MSELEKVMQRINDKLENLCYIKCAPCNEKSYELLKLDLIFTIVIKKFFFHLCSYSGLLKAKKGTWVNDNIFHPKSGDVS